MKDERASVTAAIVATFRSMGDLLPAEEQLAHDPYGAKLAGPWMEKVVALSRHAPMLPGPIERYVLYMQVRTRAIDDVMLDFVKSGGRQIVLLGAGFDARAMRFASELAGATVFEVDHPATQSKKRSFFASERSAALDNIRYLTFDFEQRAVSELPGALASLGHVASSPTLTIWEGVTMYLTEEAIAATVAAVKEYSCPGSLFAVTYFERTRMIDKPRISQRVVRMFVSRVGEPFRFGWDPGELAPWASRRGFEVISDRIDVELAREFFSPARAAEMKDLGRHIAVLRAS